MTEDHTIPHYTVLYYTTAGAAAAWAATRPRPLGPRRLHYRATLLPSSGVERLGIATLRAAQPECAAAIPTAAGAVWYTIQSGTLCTLQYSVVRCRCSMVQ